MRGVCGKWVALSVATVLPAASMLMLLWPMRAVIASARPAVPAPAPAPRTVSATVQKVVWLTDRRVALWVNSPAMGVPIQVQLLLARDWFTHSTQRFPALYLLDGLRALDTESGWTHDAHADQFFADKNVTVVMPVGGESSFYSDWLAPDKGHNYQWETFLTRELPPVLGSQWRTTDVRGVAGLSMGGTAAMFLAERNPGFARSVASYSGFLTTTTIGMPDAIRYALKEAGGFDSVDMWGSPTNPQWRLHDPAQAADRLRDISLYVSSGSGTAGPYDPVGELMHGLSSNLSGTGLEVLSRLTTADFVARLKQLHIPATVVYRPSGTHSWPYWDQELRQSWPQAATALGVPAAEPPCNMGGAIGALSRVAGWLADCVTPEYPVAGGVAQDFRFGQVFFSRAGGAHAVGGAIGGAYQMLGGPGGALGLPVGDEVRCPDGRGRFQTFRNGMIYWTPQTGAHPVRGAIFAEWAHEGFERGPLGYPVGEEVRTPNRNGAVQSFEHGALYWSPETGTHGVGGLILGKYAAMGFENSPLGFPRTNEVPLAAAGRYNAFEGGNVYFSPLSGTWAVRNGPIMVAWGATGFEHGRLGYPISDEFAVPAGIRQNFQLGYVTVTNGHATVY